MSAVLRVKDVQVGNLVIVISKIREVYFAMGNAVIVYDNGDKRTIDSTDGRKTIKDITDEIEKYHAEIYKLNS